MKIIICAFYISSKKKVLKNMHFILFNSVIEEFIIRKPKGSIDFKTIKFLAVFSENFTMSKGFDMFICSNRIARIICTY